MAGKKRSDIDSETAMMVMEEEHNMERIRAEQQVDREQRIAETYEVAGRIQAMTFIGKVATVSNLIQLKRIKDSKSYRDLPHVGTWEEFCNYLKLDRRTVDENLQNLNTFGEDFLETCQQFSLGYRDLRKLRQLTHDGAITIDAEAVVIGEERIPLTPDYKEDLQTAIEQIIEEQSRVKEELDAQKKAFDRVQTDTRKSMVKLQKDLDKFTKEADAKGLTADEDAFLQLVENWKISFDGYLMRLDPSFEATFADYERVTPRMCAALISGLHYMKMQILVAYDTAVTTHGDPAMNPELLEDYERWQQAEQQLD